MADSSYLKDKIENLCDVLNDKGILDQYDNKWTYNEYIFGGGITSHPIAFKYLKDNGHIDIGMCWRCGEHPIPNNNVFTSHRYTNIKYSLCKSCHSEGVNMQRAARLGHKSPEVNQKCYIATLCYGDINAIEVEEFRQYRDNKLSKHLLGKIFIKFYYITSPTLVYFLKDKEVTNRTIKKFLNILLKRIRNKY